MAERREAAEKLVEDIQASYKLASSHFIDGRTSSTLLLLKRARISHLPFMDPSLRYLRDGYSKIIKDYNSPGATNIFNRVRSETEELIARCQSFKLSNQVFYEVLASRFTLPEGESIVPAFRLSVENALIEDAVESLVLNGEEFETYERLYRLLNELLPAGGEQQLKLEAEMVMLEATLEA